MSGPRRRPAVCTTSPWSAPTWSGRCASTRSCWNSRSPTSSRTATTPARNHFFFDIGNGNLLAFFDFPGLDVGPYAEVLGGLHHIAISVTPDRWEHLRAKLDDAGVEYQLESKVSIYFRDPDGARLELLADPLGEMYGSKVL